MISFCSFEGVQHFWLELCIFYYKLLSETNQQLICVTESDIGQGPSNHTAPNFELLVSVLWLTLSFGEVSKPAEECTKNSGDTFHCRHSYIRENFSFFKKIIFPALIDSRNNFEIHRLIRLVVRGMFLLPCSALLMCFSSF